MKYFFTLFISSFIFFNLNAQINCTDCPSSAFVDGILTSELEVINNGGSDDLSINPLIQVCLTVQHSWIGDVAMSLEAPDGQHYILLGDEDNSWGGCQSGAVSNLNVCFVPGDQNPLTAGVPYETLCNGNGDYCLEGDFTPTCGAAAMTPDGSASAAPNCDIVDYNMPGSPISGVWTLRLYCVCPDLEFGGLLVDWSLNFQDESLLETGENTACQAFAGTGSTESQMLVCNTQNDIISYTPTIGGGQEIPTTDGFSYGSLLIGSNGSILGFSPNNEISMEGMEVGQYFLTGISYHIDAVSMINNHIGFQYSILQAAQGSQSGACFRINDMIMFVEVTVPTEMVELYTLCSGSILEIYGTEITEVGDYAFQSDIGEACDAIVYVEVLADDATSFDKIYPMVCEGQTVEIAAENGTAYLWTGPNGFTSTAQTVVLNNPDVDASGMYTCEVTSFEGCTGIQETELSLRCVTRIVELELGESTEIIFDQMVGDVDECQDAIENIVETEFTNATIILSANNEGEEEICFQAYENGLLKNITYVVNVGTPNAVDEPNVNLDINPNPATDFLQINANGVTIEQVQFFDTKGALLRTAVINDTQADVQIEDLVTQLYVLKIKTSEGVLVRKLVVQ